MEKTRSPQLPRMSFLIVFANRFNRLTATLKGQTCERIRRTALVVAETLCAQLEASRILVALDCELKTLL